MNSEGFTRRRMQTHTELTPEETQRAMGMLYRLHSHLFLREKRHRQRRLMRRK